MKILVDIGHPAHVHFYKHFIWEMEKRGHEVLVTARDKDVAVDLLDAYNIDHSVVGKIGQGKFSLIKEWIGRDISILNKALKFKPDVLTGIANPCAAHVALMTSARSVIFTDTEHARFANRITFPFASKICTPSCYINPLGEKQVRYEGYHELAYLHPNYFTPDPKVLKELSLSEKDRFFIVRFVSWNASHDGGQQGFDLEGKKRLVTELEKYGRVIITSEDPLPVEFEKYRLSVSPEKLHDLLYYATLFIGEGATIASECAVLGTPAIYVNTLRLGYLDEQEKEYGLVYNFCDSASAQDEAIAKALELIQQPNLREEWQEKRWQLLNDKINVTNFMVDLIENIK